MEGLKNQISDRAFGKALGSVRGKSEYMVWHQASGADVAPQRQIYDLIFDPVWRQVTEDLGGTDADPTW